MEKVTPQKRQRTVLELTNRLNIIDAINKKESDESIASRYHIGRSTVGDISKNRAKYLTAKDINYNPHAKVITEREFTSLIHTRVYDWLCHARARNFPGTGDQLKQKAILVGNHLNPDISFKASNGWLEEIPNSLQSFEW
jgi:hypothetical protein